TARAPRAAATRGRVPAPRAPLPSRRPTGPAAQYDPQAALDHQLARLRSTLGASRVSVWVHEATTGTAAPFRQSVCPGVDVAGITTLKNPIPVSRSPFVSAVLERCEPVVVRADGRRAADKEAARYGIRSAHGEPLVRNGEVVGLLTIEPAAAASPAPLRQAVPGIALALTEAWSRRTERRRLGRGTARRRLPAAGRARRGRARLRLPPRGRRARPEHGLLRRRAARRGR